MKAAAAFQQPHAAVAKRTAVLIVNPASGGGKRKGAWDSAYREIQHRLADTHDVKASLEAL